MSWLGDLLKRHLHGDHHESIDDRLRRFRRETCDASLAHGTREAQLEDDLDRALLLIYCLTEACLAKGVFTRDELNTVMHEIDLLDGVADGKLNPAAVRPAGNTPDE